MIKVSDHAMYCSKYESEYYVNECYAKIPLRWMAWEAVLLVSRHFRRWNFEQQRILAFLGFVIVGKFVASGKTELPSRRLVLRDYCLGNNDPLRGIAIFGHDLGAGAGKLWKMVSAEQRRCWRSSNRGQEPASGASATNILLPRSLSHDDQMLEQTSRRQTHL